MRLATDLKVWPVANCDEKPRFAGWEWAGHSQDAFRLLSHDREFIINKSHWEAEIKRLSSPHPAIKWKEGDETTAGKIAYVSTEHHNVMVRSTHSMMELDGRSLERKMTKERFIAQKLAFYLGDMSRTEAFEKIIVDAEIDWEDE